MQQLKKLGGNLFNADLTMNVDVYATLIEDSIIVKRNTTKLNQLQQIRSQVFAYDHYVVVSNVFLEQVALCLFNRL